PPPRSRPPPDPAQAPPSLLKPRRDCANGCGCRHPAVIRAISAALGASPQARPDPRPRTGVEAAWADDERPRREDREDPTRKFDLREHRTRRRHRRVRDRLTLPEPVLSAGRVARALDRADEEAHVRRRSAVLLDEPGAET